MAEILFSIENFQEGSETRDINSPRSLEACLRTGIDPLEVLPKGRNMFKSRTMSPQYLDIKCQNFEKKRQEKIALITIEREKIMQYAERKAEFTATFGQTDVDFDNLPTNEDKTSSMLAMEERRMEALKRRQEKDLARTVEKEQQAVELQIKIKNAEEEAMKKQKQHFKKVAEQKRAEEKKRQQLEQEAKRAEAEEENQKKALARKEQEIADKIQKSRLITERKLAKEGRERDEARKIKMIEYTKKTEALLKVQEDEAVRNKERMMERELVVQEQMEQKREQKRLEVAEAREKATLRIEEAMHRHHELHEQRQKEFDEKQKKAEVLAKENAILDRERMKKQVEDRDKRNNARLRSLVDAYHTRTGRRNEVIERRNEKDSGFTKVAQERAERANMLKFSSELKLSEKAENVERVARVNDFRRLQTLQRIQSMEDKYNQIQDEKYSMKTKQAEEAKKSLIRKHEITDAMDKMRVTNDYSILDKLFKKKDMKATLDEDDEKEDKRLSQTA